MLAIVLITLNGVFPFFSFPVQAGGNEALGELVTPIVSIDIDGEESKSIAKGESHHYFINVQFPENMTGYESVIISSQLDKRLNLEETAVQIDEVLDTDFSVSEEGQHVSFTVTPEQLEDLVGKEIRLQITAQIREDATEGDRIENIANVLINDSVEIDTDPVVVTVEESSNEEEPMDEETNEEDEVVEEIETVESQEENTEETENKDAAVNQEQFEDKNLLKEADKNQKTNKAIGSLESPNACAAPVALINGSFEEPIYSPDDSRLIARKGWFDAPQDAVPGWQTTDQSGLLEIMNKSLGDEIPIGDPYESLKVTPAHGQQFAELNSREAAQLYQDVETTPGQTIYWRLAHKGRIGQDTMALKIDSATVAPKDLKTIETMASGKDEWKYYSGSYVVPAGQTITRFGFEAVSSANGNVAAGNFLDDIFLGTEPCVSAEKTVSPKGDVFEDDELTYEVTVKNSGGDVAANTIVEDIIPEGTEYVPGSLKIKNGPGKGDLTDTNDEDAGHYDDGKVIFKIGDLPNTNVQPDGITVQFKVKALSSHVGKTVINKAQVKYNNLLKETDESLDTNEVTNNIIELPDPPNSCAAPVALINGSFEGGPEKGSYQEDAPYMFLESEVPGWKTTDDSQGVNIIEIWDYQQQYPGGVVNFPAPPEGNRYAELNAYDNGLLYQDVETTPGQTIYWRLSHMGRQGVDTMQLRIGAVTDNPYDTKIIEQMSDGSTAWGTYSGSYKVPAGQTVTRFGFEAVSTASGSLGAGNFLDDIFLGTEPCMAAEKSVNPEGDVSAGDELTYEVTVKNSGGDIAANTVIEDEIPKGTVYIPNSMKIVTGPNTGDLTDEQDDDRGYFDGDKVIFSIGDLPNTTELPDGVTVQFKVKTLSSHIGKDVDNQAKVKYKDLLKNEEEETDTNETKTPVKNNDPLLDSEKLAQLKIKADGNTDSENPEVGDTLRYTITTQNTIEDSLVESLVITDTIPKGLIYVSDSLEVDGESVSDAEDGDAGHVLDGKVTGIFGDITDTDKHMVTFLVTVDKGQAGEDIKNVAKVDGDNIDDPDEPEEEVKIYPREPKLESEKSAVNAEEGKEKYEVGDTVIYTIKTHNTVSDSLVENLTITDRLPTGLEYVKDSIKVSHDGKGEFKDGQITATFGDVGDTDWRMVTFEVKIISGQSGKQITNIATVDGENVDDPDEPEEKITVYPKEPELKSEKVSEIVIKAEGNTDSENPEVGDTLRYTITTQNMIEDSLVENLVITDIIPRGLIYVFDSLKVDGESVSDAEDGDAGHVLDGKVTGIFGDITDTDKHMVTFLVTVDKGQAGEDIKNVAKVDGDNIDDPDEPEEEVKIYPREPKLESEKSAVNAEEGKEKYEVGDTVIYTIKTHNTVSDSLVENLTITDRLPTGLEYVKDSIKVSHDGKGEFKDGQITATFGDVGDTDWRTVTFEVKIQSDQFDKNIINIAEVTGGNVTKSDQPEEKVKVLPKNPDTNIDQGDDEEVTTPPIAKDKKDGEKLPKTATNVFNFLLIGILIISAGVLIRRKSHI